MAKKYYSACIYHPFRTANGDYYCEINYRGKYKILPLDSKEFEMEFKSIFFEKKKELISKSGFDTVMENLRIDAYKNNIGYNLETRIFNDDDGTIVYNLKSDSGKVVWIQNGNVEICDEPEMAFKHDNMLREQVRPDLKVYERILPQLVEKHFHLQNEEDVLILTLYLVTALTGREMPHPILIISGSKGSGKSQCARLIQEIVDPQKSESQLMAVPKSIDDIAVKLNSSYMVVWDNMSKIRNQDLSNLLAIACTGGIYAKRQLYRNSSLINLQLKNLVILTGVDVVAKEPDLLDRSLILNLRRLKPNEIKSESVLNREFYEDLPKILGACFKLLASAMNDFRRVTVPKLRMCDVFELMIKVARQLGYEDQEVSEILWKNQKKVNQESLSDNVIASCLIALMQDKDTYINSVTGLLGDLQEIAENNNIDKNAMVRTPNVLSRKIGEVSSNLEQEYGITYEIKNVGAFRQITIWKA